MKRQAVNRLPNQEQTGLNDRALVGEYYPRSNQLRGLPHLNRQDVLFTFVRKLPQVFFRQQLAPHITLEFFLFLKCRFKMSSYSILINLTGIVFLKNKLQAEKLVTSHHHDSRGIKK